MTSHFIFQILFYAFVVFSVVQICYFVCIFFKFASFSASKTNTNNTKNPVSIIICAKDEAENLSQFLPQIYAQDYPDFEVVLVDDRSMDNTLEVMEQFKEKYPDKTKIVKVEFSNNLRFVGNKKYALTMGIKGAKHNNLLFTDADCQPVSNNWIAKMVEKFSDKKQLILGYGKYKEVRKSLLNKIVRYETEQTALQYFSYAAKGMPYMGVGRNMAYTKELFMENNGFYNHLDILSGDDDLFVNEVATSENTEICIHNDSFTISKPKLSWSAYLYQKRRHISTAHHYQMKHQLLLGLYYFSQIAFWMTGIFLLSTLFQWQIVLAVVLARFLLWYYINYKTMRRLDEKRLLLWLPILELSLMLFQLFIFVMNIFQKPKNWKN
jgi:glycosyltransferase involved in cell wall biosynthesis